MLKEVELYFNMPKIYTPSTNAVFWTDEHISKYLLDSHLNSNIDASSRKSEFIDKSANWISKIAPSRTHPELLDLGSGAGLYAERFASLGFNVTGIDFSSRFINYAKEQTVLNESSIIYIFKNYLEIDFKGEFDLITLIYCDFGALSDKDRTLLLHKIYKALKPSGKFILDVFSLNNFSNKHESKTWEYNSNGAFWNSEPHLCLESNYLYEEENTELRQYIVQTNTKTECYNIWEHYFTKDSFISEVEEVGFKMVDVFDNIAGKTLSNTDETLCGVFSK